MEEALEKKNKNGFEDVEWKNTFKITNETKNIFFFNLDVSLYGKMIDEK